MAPQKFSGKQGYSILDRTPDRIIALYEFVRSNPDWVDAFLDSMPPNARDTRVLDAMEDVLYAGDNYLSDTGFNETGFNDSICDEEDQAEPADIASSLVGDIDVLEATMTLGNVADSLGPEFDASFFSDKYMQNGRPRFEVDALRRHNCYDKTTKLNKILRKKEQQKMATAQYLGKYHLSDTPLSMLPKQTQKRKRKKKHQLKAVAVFSCLIYTK